MAETWNPEDIEKGEANERIHERQRTGRDGQRVRK